MNYKRERKAEGLVCLVGRRAAGAVLLALVVLSLVSGCSRPIKPKSDFITVAFGDLTFTRYLDLMDRVEFDGEQAVRFSDFIDSAITVRPQIYAYRIIGSDGFYAALKGSPDNVWEHMQKGYLKLSDRKANFDQSLGLSKRYFVTDVASVELLRKVETKFQGEEEFSFSLIVDMESATYSDPADDFYDGRPGVHLSDFIDTSTVAPEDYTYNLVSVVGEQKSFSWSELQTGWWLLDLDVTKFYPDLGPNSRISFLQTIELTPKSE